MERSQSSLNGTLALCMIAKNEEQNLPRCLASAQPFVDEMIVVDTGSTDRTVDVALSWGATVKYFTWCNDFAAARNLAIACTQSDWILMLDADEALQVHSDWRSQLSLDPHLLAYWIDLIDIHQGLTPLRTLRLFRNLPDLRYIGRYHEYLTYQNQLISGDCLRELQGVEILHYGYAEETLAEKNLNRDIPILEAIRQQEGLSLVLLSTLADDYLRIDQLEQARNCWAEAFERLTPYLLSGTPPEETVRLPALLFTLGADSLLQQQDYETALLITRRGLEWFPNYPPLLHLSGLLLKELGFGLGAIAYFNQCLELGKTGNYYRREPFDKRFITYLPAYDSGLVYQDLHRISDAKAAFQLALTFAPDFTPAQASLQGLELGGGKNN